VSLRRVDAPPSEYDASGSRCQVGELLLFVVSARYARNCSCPQSSYEDAHPESKSTFRWDFRAVAVSKVMETAVLKTVAAFLNSREGGTLLVGVADGGGMLRLESDYLTLHKAGKDDADLLQLALTMAALNSVGAAAATNVTLQVHTVGGKDVGRLHIKPSCHPVRAEVTTVDKSGQNEKKRVVSLTPRVVAASEYPVRRR
jgi:Putative DNA-binding domain